MVVVSPHASTTSARVVVVVVSRGTSVMPATTGPLMGSSRRSRNSSTSDSRSRMLSLYTSRNDTVTCRQTHREGRG